MLTAFVNQMSGINAVTVYSAKILSEVPGVDIELGVYLLALGQFVGAQFLGPLLSFFLSTQKTLIAGQFAVALSNLLIVIFFVLSEPTLLLISMFALMVSF